MTDTIESLKAALAVEKAAREKTERREAEGVALFDKLLADERATVDEARARAEKAERARDEAREGLDRLKTLIAQSKMDCIYCGVEAGGPCPSGYPGCGRMDDLLADDAFVQRLGEDLQKHEEARAAAGPPSPALAQPPAPQEGLFEKGALAMREMAAVWLARLVGELGFAGQSLLAAEVRALPLPAEPSAPQAVDVPPIERQLSEADLVTCLGKPEPHERGYLCRSPSSVPAPPAPVSAPQDNEKQLSGKGK